MTGVRFQAWCAEAEFGDDHFHDKAEKDRPTTGKLTFCCRILGGMLNVLRYSGILVNQHHHEMNPLRLIREGGEHFDLHLIEPLLCR